MNGELRDASGEMQKAIDERDTKQYVLRLFIAGTTPKSQHAIEIVKEILEKELKGRYELEVIDIYQQPELVREDQILAAPTLVKKLPLPLRRVIGDMSKKERVIIALDLTAKDEGT